MESEVLRSGLLTKRGGTVRTWKRRFFILTKEDEELKFTYYRPKTVQTGKRKGVRLFGRKEKASSRDIILDPQQYIRDTPLGKLFGGPDTPLTR